MSRPNAFQRRREDGREAALIFLAERNVLAHSQEAVRRGANREGADFTAEEIAAALAFLVSDGLADTVLHPLGASPRYQITARGIRQYEGMGG